MTTLGERLQNIRKKKGMSQRKVIDELKRFDVEISQATLSRYESDEFDTPASVLRALSKIYNIDAKYILFDESEL